MELCKHIKYFGLLFLPVACTQHINYIDPNLPEGKAEIFASGIISKAKQAEFGSIFSKNGKEFYFAVEIQGKAEIRFTQFKNGKWALPKTIISHPKYSYNDPMLTPDESKLYYISDMPRNNSDTIPDIDIWYSGKEGDSWTNPINAGTTINSDKNEYYISFTDSGRLYFASNKLASESRAHDFDIFYSEKINESYQEPVPLDKPINTGRYEADIFIAPDESYIIFCSARKDGFGKGDLHIAFKRADDTWTKPKNMGPTINSDSNEMCPFVTKDGKYFFYTSKQDIYWVRTSIFENYR